MSLVGRVGRRRWRARLAMGVVYAILCLGALTTLYPFLLMLTTGLKGPTDQNDNLLVPKFMVDDAELLAKVRDDRYAGEASAIAFAATQKEGGSATEWKAYLEKLPLDTWIAGYRTAPNQVTGKLQLRYQAWLQGKYRNIDDLNKAYIEENTGFHTVIPPGELLERKTWSPPATRKYQEWREFKAQLPAEYRLPVFERRMYQEFVRAQYQNNPGAVPPNLMGSAKTFEELELPGKGASNFAINTYNQFRARALPARYANVTAEGIWTNPANPEEGTRLGRLEGYKPMPVAPFEESIVQADKGGFRQEFASRNYRYVLDTILINGRAVINTIIFCTLAILVQLTVNPIAAYALSRYPIKQSGKILIFLLATMAFPAEVAMIPSFLLLKDLGMLNTFAALVLPTAASGYMIFLLKGFFDSLPQELFEAGQLDGAKESTMMLRIAFPLSRPVLGYLALIAFMGSYSAFIYAFLVAQDQRMWTLMVYIYQLQTTAPRAVMMAALTLAAVPTLVVFLAAQRVIMRGIVLPGER